MIKVEYPHLFGAMDALRGMRNAFGSWDKNDSTCICDSTDGHVLDLKLGTNDEKLCKILIKGGSSERKFLRQFFVSMDITAPMYWWAEMDTYKIATTRNSCSIQHTGASRDFIISDFTIDGMDVSSSINNEEKQEAIKDLVEIISKVNKWRKKFIDSKMSTYDYFTIMRQILPSGYNYKATFSGSYENLLNIYKWRKKHKIKEWRQFCSIIKTFPAMDLFLTIEN